MAGYEKARKTDVQEGFGLAAYNAVQHQAE